MTTADVLQAIRHLPSDAKVTLTVEKADLVRALEERDENPDRLVGTVWLADHLGMSREWWADNAENVDGAFQEKPGAPWNLPVGAARAYLIQYQNDRRSNRSKRSRRRGPWKEGARS